MREMPSASRARLTSDNECKHEERGGRERERDPTLANVVRLVRLTPKFGGSTFRKFHGLVASEKIRSQAEILASPFGRVSDILVERFCLEYFWK